MSLHCHRGWCCVVLLAALVASGCDPSGKSSEVKVTGKITLEGQPIPNGSIMFLAADGATPTGGGSIKDGEFVASVPPGEKIVLVTGSKLVGQEPMYPGQADSPMREKFETITPPGYNAQQLSPLKASVAADKATMDFDLKKKL